MSWISVVVWLVCEHDYFKFKQISIIGDNTPKSLTVLGTNKSLFTVQYYVFVEYKRHLEIDVETGHVNVSSN